ncbi:TonB-dependent receptor [Paraburkholderia sp. BR10954]|uniref:TonB-dependent receptor domain-containing protein n=1 Tax=Paraburkholderia sp. BR10954 TaxID=3236995 RepID=UPI0034D37B3F
MLPGWLLMAATRPQCPALRHVRTSRSRLPLRRVDSTLVESESSAPCFVNSPLMRTSDWLSAMSGLVQLTMGVRHQWVDSSNYVVSDATTYRYYQSAVTPSFALVIRPMDQVSFYANYIEALTPGSSPPTDAANPNAAFAPYKSKRVEVGLTDIASRFDSYHRRDS